MRAPWMLTPPGSTCFRHELALVITLTAARAHHHDRPNQNSSDAVHYYVDRRPTVFGGTRTPG